MAPAVVDGLQTIQIQQKNRELPAGAAGALNLPLQNVDQSAVVGEPRKRITRGEMLYLLEQARVVEQCPAQHNGVTGDAKCLRERKWRVQRLHRLEQHEMRGKIDPGHQCERL